MEYIDLALGVAILLTLFDVKEKLHQLLSKEKQNHLEFARYLHKDVYIVLTMIMSRTAIYLGQ